MDSGQTDKTVKSAWQTDVDAMDRLAVFCARKQTHLFYSDEPLSATPAFKIWLTDRGWTDGQWGEILFYDHARCAEFYLTLTMPPERIPIPEGVVVSISSKPGGAGYKGFVLPELAYDMRRAFIRKQMG